MQNPHFEPLPAIAGLSHKDLAAHPLLAELPSFRVDQVYNWIYARHVLDWEDMTNLSKALRAEFALRAKVLGLHVERRLSSAISACDKVLFRLHDGAAVEAVWMRFDRRQTLCVSTQVGCAMGCTFCATATMGLRRHLTSAEIVQQVLFFQHEAQGALSNLVFMGMGEPLHNYEHVTQACRILNDPAGMNFSRRRITVSTVGLVPQIHRLASDNVPCKLAVSLNSVFDDVRSRLMPVNRKYGLRELFDACRAYTKATGLRVTFEYVLLEGVNDRPEDIRELRRSLSQLPCKLNLIYYNQADRGYQTAARDTFQRFFDALETAHVPVTLRQSMGEDIDAACGQLSIREENERC